MLPFAKIFVFVGSNETELLFGIKLNVVLSVLNIS
jgi:hypothetical protein